MYPAGHPWRPAPAWITGLVALLWVLYYFASPMIVPNVVGMSVDDAAGEQWFRYQDYELTYTDDNGVHTIGG